MAYQAYTYLKGYFVMDDQPTIPKLPASTKNASPSSDALQQVRGGRRFILVIVAAIIVAITIISIGIVSLHTIHGVNVHLTGRVSQTGSGLLTSTSTQYPTVEATPSTTFSAGSPVNQGNVAASAVVSFAPHMPQNVQFGAVVAATDGSGNIPAYTITKTAVAGAASNTLLIHSAIAQGGGSSSYYYVPSDCVDEIGISSARQFTENKLLEQVPNSIPSVIEIYASFTYDDSSFVCYPAAGYKQSTPFFYGASENMTLTETYVTLPEVQNYQAQQLKKAVPNGFVAANIHIQDGYYINTDIATATKATIWCNASEDISYNWDQAALANLADQIAGKSEADATAIIQGSPGADNLTGVIYNLSNGSVLPTNPASITMKLLPY
jgi:hypothetical protein